MLFWAPAVHGGGALLFFSFMQVDTPYWMIALGLTFLGIGGAMHMPATTDTAMAAVPVDLAGKASAVNNAGRQLGGTLGIAILGSFAAASYASGAREGLAALPLDPATLETMVDGIGAALQLLPSLDPGVAAAVSAAVSEAFADSVTNTMRFGIVFAVISGVAAWVLVPSRQRTAQGHLASPAPTVDEALALAAAPPPNGATPNPHQRRHPAPSPAQPHPQKSPWSAPKSEAPQQSSTDRAYADCASAAAIRSPIMIAVRFVLHDTMSGIIEASATVTFSTPCSPPR